MNGGKEMTNTELKSKAMSLGNRLAPKLGGDKSAVFVKAWAIVKAGKLEMAVKGTSFGTRQEALKRLAAYKPGPDQGGTRAGTHKPGRPRSGCGDGRRSERQGACIAWATSPARWRRLSRPWARNFRHCG